MIGDLYNYLTLEQYSTSTSEYGDDDMFTWSQYTQCFAQRVDESANEGMIQNQVVGRKAVAWRVRFDSNITERMRIYFDGDYYQITGVEIEGRRKYLVLKTYKWNNT